MVPSLRPYPWQRAFFKTCKDVISHPNNQVVVLKAKRQLSKSFSASVLSIFALNNSYWRIGFVTPSFRQSRKVFKVLQSLNEQYNLHHNLSFNESRLEIESEDTHSVIVFLSAGQGENLRGETFHLLIIDEAAYVDDATIDLLMPTRIVHHAPLILCSTPLRRSGRFYSFFTNPSSIIVDWNDFDTSSVLTSEVLEYAKLNYTPAIYHTDYEGLFLDEGTSLLYGDITSQLKEIPYSNQDLVCGIDYSVSANDFCSWSLFFRDSSNNICELTSGRFRVSDASDTVSRFLADLSPYLSQIKIIMSETNSCGGAFEAYLKKALKELGNYNLANNVVSDWWSSKSKGEAIALSSTLFNTKQLFIHTPDLVSEANNYTQIISSTGKISFGNAQQGNRDYHDDLWCAALHAISGIKELSQRGNYVMI